MKNDGDSDASPVFQVGFEVNGESIGQQVVPEGLAVGDSVAVDQPWIARPGSTTVTVIADVNRVVSEPDESNNRATLPLGEIPSPDLTVTNLTSTPAARISHAQPVIFTATVFNSSTATTARDFFVALLVDWRFESSEVVRWLGGDATIQVDLSWDATFGSTSTVSVDSSDVVVELDEDNNRLSIGLPEILLSNLRISGVSTLPANVQDGQTATFAAMIENVGEGDVTGDFKVRFEVLGNQILGETTVTGGVPSHSSTAAFSSEARCSSPGLST